MEVPKIQLVRNPACHGRLVLDGLSEDQTVVDRRVVAAVRAHSYLFPHVVRGIAINRHQELVSDSQPYGPNDVPTENLLGIMTAVRDELKQLCDSPLPEHLAQVGNMTQMLRPERPPYFAR